MAVPGFWSVLLLTVVVMLPLLSSSGWVVRSRPPKHRPGRNAPWGWPPYTEPNHRKRLSAVHNYRGHARSSELQAGPR